MVDIANRVQERCGEWSAIDFLFDDDDRVSANIVCALIERRQNQRDVLSFGRGNWLRRDARNNRFPEAACAACSV
jgi:hypothetical protein